MRTADHFLSATWFSEWLIIFRTSSFYPRGAVSWKPPLLILLFRDLYILQPFKQKRLPLFMVAEFRIETPAVPTDREHI